MINPETFRPAMQAALHEAATSDDPSTQTGAALADLEGGIIVVGANRMPGGVKSTRDRMVAPEKYLVREHAEREAIYTAAMFGHRLMHSVMVTIWAPCADCARGTIEVGCDAVVRFPVEYGASSWGDSQRIADEMLHEAGVEIVDYDFPGLTQVPLRRSGKLWVPEMLEPRDKLVGESAMGDDYIY